MGFSFIKDVYPEEFQNQLPPTSAKNTEKYTKKFWTNKCFGYICTSFSQIYCPS